MVGVQMRSSQPLNKSSIQNINISTSSVKSAQNILTLNDPKRSKQNYSNPSTVSQRTSSQPATVGITPETGAALPAMKVPKLNKQIQKGQKVLLDPSNMVRHIKACLGWNVKNPKCDIDVSAFILGADGKVLGDDWFVFYGQEYSPDRSIHFSTSKDMDREFISIDLNKLNPKAEKIVFVLTINEAAENNLNFSMVKDAYIRILNADNNEELVSFEMTDYYSNVISMMIGEVYIHKGNWKCNAVGNGVAKDLAGLCELYGVNVDD